jgi:uncharacterized membrane protein YqjE
MRERKDVKTNLRSEAGVFLFTMLTIAGLPILMPFLIGSSFRVYFLIILVLLYLLSAYLMFTGWQKSRNR